MKYSSREIDTYALR